MRYHPIIALNKTNMNNEFLTMAEAAKVAPYEQGYLSLLARRGELRAKKIGRNWYTKVEWLNEYILKMKPAELIAGESQSKKVKRQMSLMRKWLVATLSIAIVAVFVLVVVTMKMNGDGKLAEANKFVPQEITKVPNDSGSFDVYGKGTMKIGEETR